MQYDETTPFHRLLATRYDDEREQEAIDILERHPGVARLEWPGPDAQGKPFIRGSTALHYAANDGKLALMRKLIEHGADVNAANANWFQSVLSWATNNARLDAIRLLLESGADPMSLHAMHAAAWGGSSAGSDEDQDYVAALQLLLEAGADLNDRRHAGDRTPLSIALESGNRRAAEYLRSLGGSET